MGAIPSEREIRSSVADNAGECPYCNWEPEGADIITTYGDYETHYEIRCKGHGCSAMYVCGEWINPSASNE